MLKRAPPALRGPALVVSLGMSVLLSSCAVGLQTNPDILSPSQVPPGLLTPTTTSVVPLQTEYVNVYLAGRQRLTAVARLVAEPASVASALAVLATGPTSVESAHGLASPISTTGPLAVRRRSGPTVLIDVGSSFTNLSEQEQVMALAQLVYTATAFPGVTAVQVRIGGKPAAVPLDTGKVSATPLTRSDYAQEAPL